MYFSLPSATAACHVRLLRRLAVALALVAGTLVVGVSGVARPAAALDLTPWSHPVPPPRCTDEQARSGDVGDCLLRFYAEPEAGGWGAAPAPGVGDGWAWNGHTYSGSPALADFEAAHIRGNATPIGTIAPGALETHTAVRILFEGFLAEIQSNGYQVRHVSGYSFRCTGDWDCSSGGPDDLSLHAWGLAIDMNSDRNPIAGYADCAAPVRTDMPEWMIRAAERWGLYWGGYGWNRDCNTAGSTNTAINRDTPHFEFRGTTEMARAIAAFNLDNSQFKCLATIADDGSKTEQCELGGPPAARTRLPVSTEPPSGASAALVNVTATDATAPGYLTLESCGAQPAGPRATSSLTYGRAEAVATMAIVPLDPDGRFCVYRASAVHSVVDVLGYLVDAAAADDAVRWVRPLEPTRVLDTRDSGAPIAGGDQRPVPGASGDMLVNLATVADAGAGYLQAGRCGALGPAAGFSHLNYAGRTPAGSTTRSNLALVRSGTTDACVFSLAPAHVVVDALATLDASDGFGWRVGEPTRALDTRTRAAGRPTAGELIEIDLGVGSPAAALALTVTEPAAAGYVSVGRCADLADQIRATGRPATSNLNHAAGQTVTNLATTAVDAGRICVFTKAAAHVIVDVQATFTSEHSVGLVPTEPHRAHDSRRP